MEGTEMKKEYDLSKMRRRRNPFARRLKKQITIRIGADTIDYFKAMAEDTGVPYQTLIDSYLTDCARRHRRLTMKWE
jgi:predicted DNA binding CopG/RHH family protein